MQTHILSGWCLGSLLRGLTPRERALCMLAAAVPDIDGFGAVVDKFLHTELYWDLHHKLAHNVLFGLAMAAILALFSTRRLKPFLIYLGLFHLHLLMDYFGSGPGWEIYYLWPFSSAAFKTALAWDLYSWQNLTASAALLMWTIAIVFVQRRTPLESLMPSLDRQIVRLFRRHPAPEKAEVTP